MESHILQELLEKEWDTLSPENQALQRSRQAKLGYKCSNCGRVGFVSCEKDPIIFPISVIICMSTILTLENSKYSIFLRFEELVQAAHLYVMTIRNVNSAL